MLEILKNKRQHASVMTDLRLEYCHTCIYASSKKSDLIKINGNYCNIHVDKI